MAAHHIECCRCSLLPGRSNNLNKAIPDCKTSERFQCILENFMHVVKVSIKVDLQNQYVDFAPKLEAL